MRRTSVEELKMGVMLESANNQRRARPILGMDSLGSQVKGDGTRGRVEAFRWYLVVLQ